MFRPTPAETLGLFLTMMIGCSAGPLLIHPGSALLFTSFEDAIESLYGLWKSQLEDWRGTVMIGSKLPSIPGQMLCPQPESAFFLSLLFLSLSEAPGTKWVETSVLGQHARALGEVSVRMGGHS